MPYSAAIALDRNRRVMVAFVGRDKYAQRGLALIVFDNTDGQTEDAVRLPVVLFVGAQKVIVFTVKAGQRFHDRRSGPLFGEFCELFTDRVDIIFEQHVRKNALYAILAIVAADCVPDFLRLFPPLPGRGIRIPFREFFLHDSFPHRGCFG